MFWIFHVISGVFCVVMQSCYFFIWSILVHRNHESPYPNKFNMYACVCGLQKTRKYTPETIPHHHLSPCFCQSGVVYWGFCQRY